MLDSALMILSQFNIYSIFSVILIGLFLLSVVSNRFKQGVKVPLQICTIIWVIFFGYKLYTGNNLYYDLTAPSQSKIEAANYKKVMIDGREVRYNKLTGEVVKKSK